MVNSLPADTGDLRNTGSVPGWGGSPGRRPSKPLQYSCQENPKDREAWQATVRSVAESQTQLNSDLAHTHKLLQDNVLYGRTLLLTYFIHSGLYLFGSDK